MAFQPSTTGLASLTKQLSTIKFRAATEQSPSHYSRLFVASYTNDEQQYPTIEEQESLFQHHHRWNNDDDDTTSWFPMTDSTIEDFISSRQKIKEEVSVNGEEPPTSTEILLDSLKPKPIDTVTTQDIEEQFLRMVSNEVEYKQLLGQSPYALTDIKFPVLLQRFLDNIEDSSQKNNGKFKGQSKLKGRDQPRDERKTVVVLGTGWASHAFVKLASTYDLRIVVVSPVNHFVFT